MENNIPEVKQLILSFVSDPPIGGGSMTLTLQIQSDIPIIPTPVRASATGTIDEGTHFPEKFTVTNAQGVVSNNWASGKVNGQAVVYFPAQAIGQYIAPFSATFEINDSSKPGTGRFSVGNHSYNCTVKVQQG